MRKRKNKKWKNIRQEKDGSKIRKNKECVKKFRRLFYVIPLHFKIF